MNGLGLGMPKKRTGAGDAPWKGSKALWISHRIGRLMIESAGALVHLYTG